ncbi:alpha/beta hydrolase [Marinoscillum sp. MHG1-6]|uniref:alpha/beta hydrolase n=1 Tax=Marinoscillum sp. MHG1-6 TaxID=2959627 RepID=UPI002157A371|nr:alpha/beta hydrolase [Marinoscillum sp. MHG1-6]
MKVYGIGGLGVDKRVFSELTLNFDITPLEWINPEPNETIQNYAARLSEQIDTKEPFGIIGISFGGMMAIELNKILKPQLIVLISSAASKSDIPIPFRIFGRTGLLKITPNFLLKPPQFLANYFFGVTEPKYKKILKQIIADTNIDFLRWATNQITIWDNHERPTNMLRIHGTSDRLLNFCQHDDVTVIPKAGHFMVMNKADELSQILNHIMKYER